MTPAPWGFVDTAASLRSTPTAIVTDPGGLIPVIAQVLRARQRARPRRQTESRPLICRLRLGASLLKQQVIAVRRPGVQDAVLPVLAGGHQLLPVRHACLAEQLLRLLQIAYPELPGEHPVRAGRRETLMPLNAELDLPVAKRDEIRVLGTLVGHPKPETEVEIPFGPQIAHEQNGEDPPKHRCHSATLYRAARARVESWHSVSGLSPSEWPRARSACK